MILGMTSIICFTIIIVVALFIVNPDEFRILGIRKRKILKRLFISNFQKRIKKVQRAKKPRKVIKRKKKISSPYKSN
ncbi:MAG: hypothetical protein ACRCWG_05780 [Sarcina sp.]